MDLNQELVVLRIVAAFLIAPLVTPLTFIVLGLIRTGGFDADAVTFVVIIIGMYAYLAMIVLGIPAFFIFRRDALEKSRPVCYWRNTNWLCCLVDF